MNPQPQLVELMRLLLPERRIDTIVRVHTSPRIGLNYHQLWQWIGGPDGVVHPHPHTRFWIQDTNAPALQTSDAHLHRGED